MSRKGRKGDFRFPVSGFNRPYVEQSLYSVMLSEGACPSRNTSTQPKAPRCPREFWPALTWRGNNGRTPCSGCGGTRREEVLPLALPRLRSVSLGQDDRLVKWLAPDAPFLPYFDCASRLASQSVRSAQHDIHVTFYVTKAAPVRRQWREFPWARPSALVS